MEIGIYGGTFNPVHLGHIHLLRAVMETGWLDELLVMPDRTPPHKEAPGLINGEKRAEMLSLALEGMKGVRLSRLELESEGKSYTYLTLRRMKELFPNDRFSLIMGADMLLSFDKWRRWEEILENASLIAAARDEGEYERLLEKAAQLGKTRVLKIEPLPISSTDVRLAAKQGRSLSGLVPEAVEAYIRQNHLYQE